MRLCQASKATIEKEQSGMVKKVALIIPVYNRIEVTKTGLQKLFYVLRQKSTDHSYTVIVVDDGSSDGTSEWIKRNYKDNVVLLQGDGNLWWSGAINKGAHYALEALKADYVLLWNDDVIPRADYFDNLDRHLGVVGENTIIGSKVLDDQTNKIWFNGAYYSKVFGYVKHIKKEKSNRRINCLTGMGTLIPANIVLKQNYWDAAVFPQYYGDLDFSLRSFNTQTKLRMAPDLVLYNNTKHSSFNQERRLGNYFKSLTKIQSRYNTRIESLFHRRHSMSFIWRFTMLFKHSLYLLENIIKSI